MPKDWEAAYENDTTPWDKGYAAPPLSEFLETRSIAGDVLIPGCGTGHDVRLLAAQGAKVLGLDIAQGALDKAAKFDCAGDESYELGDFLNLSPRYVERFDYVFEHTCLCAIDLDQRPNYARSLRQALKPGGYFLSIFFRQVRDYDGNGPPYPITQQEIETLFGKHFKRLYSFVPEKTYPSRPFGCEEVVLYKLKRSAEH
ncbi:MAG: methyltransferase domain-containing protein [Verrucomicrobiota bacterium]